MTPLERESLPQMFFAAALRSAPAFPGGLLAPQDLPRGSAHMEKLKIETPPPSSALCGCFRSLKTNTKKCGVQICQNPAVFVIEGVISQNTAPPTPLAKLSLYILSTICCFIVKK